MDQSTTQSPPHILLQLHSPSECLPDGSSTHHLDGYVEGGGDERRRVCPGSFATKGVFALVGVAWEGEWMVTDTVLCSLGCG